MTKKLTAIILSLLIMLICSAAYADASLDAQADKAQVSAGDTVTVTITLKGDKLAAAEGSFAYDTSLLSFEEAEGGAGDGYISMVSLSKGGESSLSARITFKALAEAQSELAEAAKNADDETFFDASAATNTELRGILNDLFGEDICTPIWGTMDLTALSDGLPLWFNFMMALIDEIDANMENVKDIRSARLDAYLAKYKKK